MLAATVIWSRQTVLTLSGKGIILIMEAIWPRAQSELKLLDLRLTEAAKHRLKAAAAASHRSVSDFVLESALARADEALADRQFFGLDAKQWRAFTAALDAPPRALPRIHRLLREPGFFDSPES